MIDPREQRGIGLIELVIVAVIVMVVIAIATPSFVSTRRNYQALADARDAAAEILLAKMRAASDFTQTRAYFDTSAQSYHLEIWDKVNNQWVNDNPTGVTNLFATTTLGTGSVTKAPDGTAIAQAPKCRPGTAGPPASPGGGSDIDNTACVVFNSRGIPVDNNSSPTSSAIYLTDKSGVYATTIIATGLIQSYRTDSNDTAGAKWQKR